RPVPTPGGHRQTQTTITQTRMPMPGPFSTGGFDAPVAAPESKSKGKGLAIFFFALLVLGGGAVGGYTWYQNRPGKIEITTTPAESTILVDNVKVAERSPFTIDRAPGSCAVSVVRPGYTRNDQNVLVRAGMTSNLNVTLEPAPDTGFELTSVPPGGLVWLDGNAMTGPDGQARTDFRAYKIPPGKHLLEIKGDPKIQPWSEEIVIEPGTIKRVKAILTMIGEPGRPAAPPPAGVAPPPAPGGAEPARPAGPAPGGATAIHRRPRPRERGEGDETSGGGSTRERDDESASADCTITVGTRPWSEIWIDGKNTGRHTPYSESIPCGKHKLSFRRPDLNLQRNEVVTIKPGEKFKQSYPLEEEQ
ncbi:MAG TPA: PEGA domain-containing protein, partial [Polyangia bacterium]|nr:PEGA domain-containing protein [Polyangia bacterium]